MFVLFLIANGQHNDFLRELMMKQGEKGLGYVVNVTRGYKKDIASGIEQAKAAT